MTTHIDATLPPAGSRRKDRVVTPPSSKRFYKESKRKWEGNNIKVTYEGKIQEGKDMILLFMKHLTPPYLPAPLGPRNAKRRKRRKAYNNDITMLHSGKCVSYYVILPRLHCISCWFWFIIRFKKKLRVMICINNNWGSKTQIYFKIVYSQHKGKGFFE